MHFSPWGDPKLELLFTTQDGEFLMWDKRSAPYLGYLKVSGHFSVLKGNLETRVKQLPRSSEKLFNVHLRGRPDLSDELQKRLVPNCIVMNEGTVA